MCRSRKPPAVLLFRGFLLLLNHKPTNPYSLFAVTSSTFSCSAFVKQAISLRFAFRLVDKLIFNSFRTDAVEWYCVSRTQRETTVQSLRTYVHEKKYYLTHEAFAVLSNQFLTGNPARRCVVPFRGAPPFKDPRGLFQFGRSFSCLT